jgi:hypothetical protein
MRVHPRKLTVAGLGLSPEDEMEAPPESMQRPLSCPPVATSTRYSYVAPRRPTLSMLAVPLPQDAAFSRCPTLRLMTPANDDDDDD